MIRRGRMLSSFSKQREGRSLKRKLGKRKEKMGSSNEGRDHHGGSKIWEKKVAKGNVRKGDSSEEEGDTVLWKVKVGVIEVDVEEIVARLVKVRVVVLGVIDATEVTRGLEERRMALFRMVVVTVEE